MVSEWKAIAVFRFSWKQEEDRNFYLIFNPHDNSLSFTLPGSEWGEGWEVLLDTLEGFLKKPAKRKKAREAVQVEARSVTVCRAVP